MKENILVAGGTGFIGKNFILYLLKKKNFNIYSLSNKKIKKEQQNRKVKYIFCNLKDKNQLKKRLDFKLHYIVNFAGHINHYETKKTYETHYLGLKNLSDIFCNKKIKKFVQIGSSVEYGFLKSPQNEESNTDVKKLKSVYGKSKLRSTNYLMKLFLKKNFPVIVLRPYLIYGPGQNIDRLIPITILNCLKNNSFNCSSGRQIRNFIYVNDFVKIVYKCLFAKVSGDILNVGSPKSYKVSYLINKINRLIGKGFPQYGKIKLRNDEPLNLYPNLKKLKKNIKIDKQINIEDGLKKTIYFYKKHYG